MCCFIEKVDHFRRTWIRQQINFDEIMIYRQSRFALAFLSVRRYTPGAHGMEF